VLARPEQLQNGGRRGNTGGKCKPVLPGLQRSERQFKRLPRRVASAGVFKPARFSNPVLLIRGRLVYTGTVTNPVRGSDA
jgi:hypothetical protein